MLEHFAVDVAGLVGDLSLLLVSSARIVAGVVAACVLTVRLLI